MKLFLQQFVANLKRTISKLLSYPYSITITIVLSFAILFYLFVAVDGFGFKHAASTVSTDILQADKIRDSLIYRYKDVNKCTAALANQYDYISLYKKQHLDMAKIFEIYYYAFVLILVIASVITSLLGVLIARTGWQNQSTPIRAAFIGFFFSASFCGVCMNVFNNSGNASKNITKYFYFTNLQTNIYEAMAIGDKDSLDKKCSDSTLLRVFGENNKSIKANMDLFFDINTDKVPNTDINKTVGSNK